MFKTRANISTTQPAHTETFLSFTVNSVCMLSCKVLDHSSDIFLCHLAIYCRNGWCVFSTDLIPSIWQSILLQLYRGSPTIFLSLVRHVAGAATTRSPISLRHALACVQFLHEVLNSYAMTRWKFEHRSN